MGGRGEGLMTLAAPISVRERGVETFEGSQGEDVPLGSSTFRLEEDESRIAVVLCLIRSSMPRRVGRRNWSQNAYRWRPWESN